MKIAFVIQRYGSDILGRSEYHCRLIAERLAERHEVEVLTTCARDYITWNNEYPEGTDRVRGVTVRRFANAHPRDIVAFNRYSDWIFNNPHSREDEHSWLEQQGPWCPQLLDHLERHHQTYDALIFFTYLYAPTVLGLQVAPAKSILVPTAHDEPAIHLGIYRDMFALPAAIAYNTEVERRFLTAEFAIGAVAEETVGCGVDLPQQSRVRNRADDDASADEDAGPAGGAPAGRWAPAAKGAAFRGRHKIHGPFALYGGRIEKGKGCEELVEYFSTYHGEGGHLTLALMGVKLMPLPEEPYIRFAGLLSERERLQALEAFAVGTPILANARSDVLVDHCLRSNAGLFYADRDEFVECLKLLATDDRLRAQMGRNGREYVRENYRWDLIMGKYEKLMGAVRKK